MSDNAELDKEAAAIARAEKAEAEVARRGDALDAVHEADSLEMAQYWVHRYTGTRLSDLLVALDVLPLEGERAPTPTLAEALQVPEIKALVEAARGSVTDMQRAGLLWSAERVNVALRRIAEGVE